MKQGNKGHASSRILPSELVTLTKTMRKAEKTLELHAREIASLRGELRASETILAAERLRALNESQARAGVERLQADLESMRARGVIDARGGRRRKDLPAEMREGAPDVV